jgi:hypothetical protein
MLGSNQRPLPCEGRSLRSQLFTSVRKLLQTGKFVGDRTPANLPELPCTGVLMVYQHASGRQLKSSSGSPKSAKIESGSRAGTEARKTSASTSCCVTVMTSLDGLCSQRSTLDAHALPLIRRRTLLLSLLLFSRSPLAATLRSLVFATTKRNHVDLCLANCPYFASV